ESPYVAKFFVSALRDGARHPQLAAVVNEWVTEVAAFLNDLVAEGVRSGDLDPNTDPVVLVGLIQALILGFSEYSAMAPVELPAPQISSRRYERWCATSPFHWNVGRRLIIAVATLKLRTTALM